MAVGTLEGGRLACESRVIVQANEEAFTGRTSGRVRRLRAAGLGSAKQDNAQLTEGRRENALMTFCRSMIPPGVSWHPCARTYA